jgi:hypothetical protein
MARALGQRHMEIFSDDPASGRRKISSTDPWAEADAGERRRRTEERWPVPSFRFIGLETESETRFGTIGFGMETRPRTLGTRPGSAPQNPRYIYTRSGKQRAGRPFFSPPLASCRLLVQRITIDSTIVLINGSPHWEETIHLFIDFSHSTSSHGFLHLHRSRMCPIVLHLSMDLSPYTEPTLPLIYQVRPLSQMCSLVGSTTELNVEADFSCLF